MDFEIAVVAVGLARQEAFELAPRGFGAQLFECGLGLGDDTLVALGLTQFYELECLCNLALNAAIARYRVVEPRALAQQLLRGTRIVPQPRVFDLAVQFGEAPGRGIPVKDASSAVPATF
jgi:hypothetical protein